MIDGFGRTIDYLRISVTDRCNMHCNYCQPNGIQKLPMSEILTYEQIMLICKAAVKVGITKFKITGGEPFVRKNICTLIGNLKKLSGVEQVTLTTNGILIRDYIPFLREIQIDGINVSLDTLNPVVFEKITGVDALGYVLESIDNCLSAGIKIKLNCVLQKEINPDAYIELLEYVRNRKLDIRFIELMPLGYGKKSQGINNFELLEKIIGIYGSCKMDYSKRGNGPAVYIRVPGFKGRIGFISAINDSFCCNCNRLRLTSTGSLKPCLCYGESIDLKSFFYTCSGQELDDNLENAFLMACKYKPMGHQFGIPEMITENKTMVQIGG